MSDPELVKSGDVPKTEAASTPTPGPAEVIDKVPAADLQEAVDKSVSVSKEMVTEVPAELGGAAVHAQVAEAEVQKDAVVDAANEQQRQILVGQGGNVKKHDDLVQAGKEFRASQAEQQV